MPLMDALKSGVDLVNASKKGVYDAFKAKYAPYTLGAEAASKLAYAQLMGPQFTAKLMGNDAILANIPDDQKRAIIAMITGAGTGVSGGLGATYRPPSNIPSPIPMPSPTFNAPRGGLAASNQDFGANNRATPEQVAYIAQNGNQGLQDSSNIPSLPQGQQQSQNLPPPQSQQTDTNAITGTDPNSEIGMATTAWMNSPEAYAQAQKEGMYTIPERDQLLAWYRNKGQGAAAQPTRSPETLPAPQGKPPTFSENVANYKGVVKEGEKQGELRAQDVKDLNDASFNSQTASETLNSLINIASSPEFEQIRQTPLMGHHELAYYSKEGTPAQQNMVGQYYTLTGNLIKDASRDFAGQFRKGEQQLLQGMKPNPSDTVDTARGKLEALAYLNEVLGQRSKLTAQFMNEYHLNKGEAMEMADKMIKGNEIRQVIHDKLNPTVTIRNKKTGEQKTIPVAQARQMGIK